MVHLPAFTVDQGLPTWVGPYALSVVGIANIIGTFIAGQSGRFIEKRRGLSLIYFGRAVLFLGFLYLPITPVTVIVALRAAGAVVARHHPADQRPRRHLLRHHLDVDAVRHRLPVASGRLVPRRLARRADLRHDQVLRRHVVDLDRARCAGRAHQLADPGEAGGEAGGRLRAQPACRPPVIWSRAREPSRARRGSRSSGDQLRPPRQCAKNTGSSAAPRMWLVAPPKIICRSRLCV